MVIVAADYIWTLAQVAARKYMFINWSIRALGPSVRIWHIGLAIALIIIAFSKIPAYSAAH
jgi:hypothetical protein